MNNKTIRVYLNLYLLYRNSKSNQSLYSNIILSCVYLNYIQRKTNISIHPFNLISLFFIVLSYI